MPTVFESIRTLTNVVTGATFSCKVKNIDAVYSFRTAVVKSIGSSGGIDAHAGSRDPMEPRTVSMTIVHVYNQLLPPAQQTPGLVESFTSVYAAFDAVCGQGQPVKLTMTDANGNLWFNTARVKQVDKKEGLGDVSSVEIPVQFEFFVPYWAAQYKANILRADSNPLIYADGTPILYADTDPDKFAITSTFTTRVVANTGVGGGTMPDYTAGFTLVGPIPGPITISNENYVASSGAQVSLTYNASVAAGETVVIDSVNQDVVSSISGSAAYANLIVPYANGQDDWFVVGVGNNAVDVYCGAGANGSVIVNWLPYRL